MASSTVQERLGWEITPERYRQIRALWVAHSKADDARDLAGLISTVAPACVYPRHEKFAGERIYFDRAALAAGLGGEGHR